MSWLTLRRCAGGEQKVPFVRGKRVEPVLSHLRTIAQKIRCAVPTVFWRTIVRLLVCTLPLGLLLDVRSTFYLDWFNHLWMIDYYAEYFRQHHVLPDVFITNTVVGIPVPLFYGGKFYALTGIIGSFVGSAVAFRLVAFLALLIQLWHVERAVRCVSNGYRLLPLTVAAIVTWGIYSLTNLYNRSALTEFVAVAFLTAAVSCALVLVIRLASGWRSYYDAISVGLFYAAAAVTHPLTALFGSIIIASIGLAAVVTLRRSWFLGVSFFTGLLIGTVLAPWLYVCYRFSASLPISDPVTNRTWFQGKFFFPESIDNAFSRLSPIPIDWRVILEGISIETPYLEAQISVPLVLIAVALTCFWRNSERGGNRKYKLLLQTIGSLSFALFWLFLFVSIRPSISGFFGGFFDILQFPYRLTTYINLATFIVVFALAGLTDWGRLATDKFTSAKTAVVIICVTLSLCALSLKLIHADAVRSVDPLTNSRNLTQKFGLPLPADLSANGRSGIWGPVHGSTDLPTTYYGYFSYSVLDGLATTLPVGFEVSKPIKFLPGQSSRFGEVDPADVYLAEPTLVATNVQPFPWNVLFVDGGAVQRRNVLAMPVSDYPRWMGASLEAIPLSAGRHVLEYRFIPEKCWSILNTVSWTVLMGWIVIWLVVAIRPERVMHGPREGESRPS
jgi:hypothetical protein